MVAMATSSSLANDDMVARAEGGNDREDGLKAKEKSARDQGVSNGSASNSGFADAVTGTYVLGRESV